MAVDGRDYRDRRHVIVCVEYTIAVRPAEKCECQTFADAGVNARSAGNFEAAATAADARAICERQQ